MQFPGLSTSQLFSLFFYEMGKESGAIKDIHTEKAINLPLCNSTADKNDSPFEY